jgi:hypothetical protein
MATMPSSLLKEAPVGQARTQAGLSQCMHKTGVASIRYWGNTPDSSKRTWDQKMFLGTLLWILQATMQAVQPIQRDKSMTIP